MTLASLPLFHRIAGTPVIVLGEGEAALAKRRLVERAGGVIVTDENAAGVRIAFVALDDPAPTAERLRARGLMVNVPDRPELCDFTVPAILDRDPVLLAIGTSGASAGLAKALRLRLERLLPPSLGELARGLFAARGRLRKAWPDGGDRRRALDRALDAGGPLDPLASESASRLDAWLDAPDSAAGAQLVEIRVRSADPDDLTLREARLLGSVDLLLHEAGIPAPILDRARQDAARQLWRDGDEIAQPSSGLTLLLRH